MELKLASKVEGMAVYVGSSNSGDPPMKNLLISDTSEDPRGRQQFTVSLYTPGKQAKSSNNFEC